MQAHQWGLKTFYYSLINKAGAKRTDEQNIVHDIAKQYLAEPVFEDDDCEACKL
jgi:hypothetical protein